MKINKNYSFEVVLIKPYFKVNIPAQCLVADINNKQ